MTRKRKRLRRRRRRILLLLLILLLVRLWMDNRTVVTRDYDVYSPDIPASFEGYRIAVISDLHGNSRLYPRLLRAAAAAEPDIIALTGDLADAEEQRAELEPLLCGLTEIARCYYVSGNHEWAELNAEKFFTFVAETGVRVLRNEWVPLSSGGETLALAGLEDPNGYADMKTPQQVYAGLRGKTDAYVVTLCHRPELFPELAVTGYDLVLSGHNHGGLWRLPFVGGLVSPSGLFPEYDRGLFTLGDSAMLVSPGLNAAAKLPRLFNRPEVCVAVLHTVEK